MGKIRDVTPDTTRTFVMRGAACGAHAVLTFLVLASVPFFLPTPLLPVARVASRRLETWETLPLYL